MCQRFLWGKYASARRLNCKKGDNRQYDRTECGDSRLRRQTDLKERFVSLFGVDQGRLNHVEPRESQFQGPNRPLLTRDEGVRDRPRDHIHLTSAPCLPSLCSPPGLTGELGPTPVHSRFSTPSPSLTTSWTAVPGSAAVATSTSHVASAPVAGTRLLVVAADGAV